MERTAGVPRNGWVLLLLAALLLVDLLLMLLFLRWAYVTHYQLTGSAFFGRDYLSLNEGGAAEVWCWLKLAAACALVASIARARHDAFFHALAALLLVMLLAESLQVHERLSALVTALLGADQPLGLDPLIKAALAGGPLWAMALAWRGLAPSDRRPAALVAAPVLMLGGVAGAVDFLHSLWERHFAGGRTWTTLVEEGGEAVLSSVALAAALAVWMGLRVQASARSAAAR